MSDRLHPSLRDRLLAGERLNRVIGIHSGSAQQARQALLDGCQIVSLMTDLRIYTQAVDDAVREATPP
jgi:hypothetical protein